MILPFEQIIKDSTKALATNEDFRKMILHNLGNYLQIQSSYKICKENFFDLDFRTDYWWKPEIRLLGKYYIDYFKNDFYPPEELRHQLFEAFTCTRRFKKGPISPDCRSHGPELNPEVEGPVVRELS